MVPVSTIRSCATNWISFPVARFPRPLPYRSLWHPWVPARRVSGWTSHPARRASEVAQPAGPSFPDYGFLSRIPETHRRGAASLSTCRAVSGTRGGRSGMLPRTFISGRPREAPSVGGFHRVCFVHRLTVSLQPWHTTLAHLRAPRRMLSVSAKGPRVCREPLPCPSFPESSPLIFRD